MVLPWVRIVANGPNGAVAGSGFAVGGEPSLIVTAAHVVDGATSVALTFAREDGGVERAAATQWTSSVGFDARTSRWSGAPHAGAS